MKRSIWIILSLVVFIFYGCETNKNRNLIHLNLLNALDCKIDYKLSQFVDNIEYLTLETRKECLVGKIRKITMGEDCWFVASKKTPVFQFNKSGKFIKVIGGIGKGPGEYRAADNVLWDKQRKEILIFDGLNYRIMVYSIMGEFLRSWETPKFMAGYWKIDSCNYFADSPNQREQDSKLFRSFFFNDTGRVFPGLIDKKKTIWKREYVLLPSTCSMFGDSRIYLPAKSDTAYLIKNKTLIPFLYLDKGSKKMPEDLYLDQKTFIDMRDKYISMIFLNNIDDRRLFIRLYYKKKMEIGILDTKSKKVRFVNQQTYTGNHVGITNDIDGGFNLNPSRDFDSGIFYQYYDAFYLKEQFNNGFFKNREAKDIQKKEEFIRIIQNLKNNDNPVIIKYDLK